MFGLNQSFTSSLWSLLRIIGGNMALIKMNREVFINSLEPGICAYVMQQFEKKLEEKLNKVVEEVYQELNKELPKQIKTKIIHAFSLYDDSLKIDIEVDLTDGKKS